jgi:hypothetical protein
LRSWVTARRRLEVAWVMCTEQVECVGCVGRLDRADQLDGATTWVRWSECVG